MPRAERLVTWLLVSLGLQALAYFLGWWATPGRIAHLPLFVLFTAAAWFSAFRMFANWVALLHVERPAYHPPPPGWTVDVVTTAAPGEPLALFEATLPALVNLRYPHRTYLLDDSGREELRRLCQTLGIHYIRRPRPGEGGKAGNVNYGLMYATGEFVAIFDPDHAPVPEFLDRVLGYFIDPRVGYVQAPQVYRNETESIVARGAAEQTYELYGPTMMGLHGLEAPLLFGCHTTFRRAALDSIGGYAVHNAEDLRTAMRLTARGWKGVYVPEVLARGLAPVDLATFFRQQFRWAHSVFDLFFRDYWRLVPRWTVFQAVAFFMVGTYYFVGPAILVNLLLAPLLLFTGARGVADSTASFAAHLGPLVACNLLIRRWGQRYLLRAEERGWHPTGMVMLFASAFAHTAGLLAALAGIRVPYLVTHKTRQPSGLGQVRLHLLVATVSVAAILYSLVTAQPDAALLQLLTLWNAVMMGTTVWIALDEETYWRHADPSRPTRERTGAHGTPLENRPLGAADRLAAGPVVGRALER
ncbi:MAG: glycosyltransferase [Armatimonadota bacterium]|nr:glycosyltransferase [Armatimonadota bacterium]MDR7531947.1 glycosyltransferase [Armatimonadota bacterium]